MAESVPYAGGGAVKLGFEFCTALVRISLREQSPRRQQIPAWRGPHAYADPDHPSAGE